MIFHVLSFRNHGITSIYVRKMTCLWHSQVKNMTKQSCVFLPEVYVFFAMHIWGAKIMSPAAKVNVFLQL